MNEKYWILFIALVMIIGGPILGYMMMGGVILTIFIKLDLLQVIRILHRIMLPRSNSQNVSEEPQEKFCKYMVSELDRYDNDLNWNDSEYTILQAEVEMERSIFSGMHSIVKDLVAEISRDSKTRSFLVIGDPGAGKSVSLRRLARELYKENQDTDIVPVYINLREWITKEPTDEDLKKFILENLKQIAATEVKIFLEEEYETMFKEGKFFFIVFLMIYIIVVAYWHQDPFVNHKDLKAES